MKIKHNVFLIYARKWEHSISGFGVKNVVGIFFFFHEKKKTCEVTCPILCDDSYNYKNHGL